MTIVEYSSQCWTDKDRHRMVGAELLLFLNYWISTGQLVPPYVLVLGVVTIFIVKQPLDLQGIHSQPTCKA